MEHLTRIPTVGCILDEFSYHCFSPECKLISLHPDRWISSLDSYNFDFILCESAWKSYGAKFEIGTRNPQKRQVVYKKLQELTRYARKKNIPTIFWNKEDNKHFTHFKKFAGLFDYIFTTDDRTVKLYKDAFPNVKAVKVLTFAAQPLIHNPIRDGKVSYEGDVFFAGSWYKFAERQKEMLTLLRLPSFVKLHIYDRWYTDDKKTEFPKVFHKCLRKGIPYLDVVKKYKTYPIVMNVNSVRGSNTMFSRRIPEALAVGTAVISTPTPSINRYFAPHVFVSTTLPKTISLIKNLLENPGVRDANSHLARRKIMSNHTYFNRLQDICASLRIEIPKRRDGVVVICIEYCNQELNEQLRKQLHEQTYPNIVHNITFNLEKTNIMTEVIRVLYDLFINRRLPRSPGSRNDIGFVAVMHAGNTYEPNYLLDTIHAFLYATNADIVGKASVMVKANHQEKSSHLFPNLEHCYTPDIHPHTAVMTLKGRDIDREQRYYWLLNSLGDMTKKVGNLLIYSTDHYSFIHTPYVPEPDPSMGHTYIGMEPPVEEYHEPRPHAQPIQYETPSYAIPEPPYVPPIQQKTEISYSGKKNEYNARNDEERGNMYTEQTVYRPSGLNTEQTVYRSELSQKNVRRRFPPPHPGRKYHSFRNRNPSQLHESSPSVERVKETPTQPADPPGPHRTTLQYNLVRRLPPTTDRPPRRDLRFKRLSQNRTSNSSL